ncbi:MAG: hypothetical protein P0120_21890 [Nitrospira sp.]|nr:hypothetical protein [Nitrospira sp.]
MKSEIPEFLAPIVAIAMLLLAGVFGFFGIGLAAVCVAGLGGFAWALPDVTGMRGMGGHAGGAEQFVTMMRFAVYCVVAALIYAVGSYFGT